MAEGVNVRFSGALRSFVESKTGDDGLYTSVSEYVRDLVRRDYETEENRKWDRLHHELKPGLDAPDDSFVKLDSDEILAIARKRREKYGS